MKEKRMLGLRRVSILVLLMILRLIALFVASVAVAQAVDTGWLDPSSGAGYGSQNFSNPTNAYHDDTSYADGIASRDNPVGQEYYGYVTDIPAGYVIQGIEVQIHYWLDGAGNTNTMEVALSSDGTNWTTARTDTSEPKSETPVTFGSGSDLWGRAWSVADISNLRVRVRGITAFPGNRTFYLDWVGVRVTYNSPPTISDIGDQNTDEDTAVGPIDFTVGDADTPAASLVVSGESSDTTLVPNTNIVFGFGISDADRTVTITPTADLFGWTVITVTVDDGSLTASDSFTLTVDPVNDAPVANDDTYSVDEGGTLTISAPGVLDNDTDADVGDTLTATLVSDVSNGTLSLEADGSFTYVHDGSETSSDSFTYQADDGIDLSNVAIVTITITTIPEILIFLPVVLCNS